MTRPMPGPPEDWWYCTPPHGEPGLCTPDMDPAEYMPFTHLQHKRLTGVECAAEYWQAFCYRARALSEIINLPPHEARRIVKESDTWHRFDTHHHALEES